MQQKDARVTDAHMYTLDCAEICGTCQTSMGVRRRVGGADTHRVPLAPTAVATHVRYTRTNMFDWRETVMKIVNWIGVGVSLACLAVCGHQVAAAATSLAVPDEASVLDLLRPVYDALTGGQYTYGTLLLIVAAVALTKRFVPLPWLHTDTGGSVLVAIGTTAAALAVSAAIPGTQLSIGAVSAAFKAGIMAAGGYVFIKNVIITPLLPRLPAWLQKILTPILWVFDGSMKPGEVALKEAVAEGNKAILIKPSQGVVSIVGDAKDVL